MKRFIALGVDRLDAVVMDRADRLLARRAARRYGVFTRSDAVEAGLSERALDHRIKARAYDVLWPGTYAMPGSPSTWERSAVAAVLHAGPVAALSHGAAARVFGVSGFERADIEVTTSRQIQAVDFIVHPRTRLEPFEVVARRGIPTTSVERALLDLSSALDADRLEAMVDHVCDKRLTTADRLSTYLTRSHLPKRRRSVLLRVLDERGPVEPAASDLETLVAQMLRDPSLPRPVRQFEVIHGAELIARPDFAYREVRFGIEAHSFKFHHTRAHWERDLKRHRRLEAVDWYLMYITWDDCMLRRAETMLRIRRVLDQRRRMFGLDPLPG